jgi:hypothetical protein
MRRIALAGFFWLALAFTLVMAWLPHPPSVPGNPNDKMQHIAAFSCLSLVGAVAFPNLSLARLGERLSFLGAIIEVVQSISALHRDCDVRDWIADTIAIVIVLLAVAAYRRFCRSPMKRPIEVRSDLGHMALSLEQQNDDHVVASTDPIPVRGDEQCVR